MNLPPPQTAPINGHLSSTPQFKPTSPINQRDSLLAIDNSPAYGSFALVKDLVLDYNKLDIDQTRVRLKQNENSVRAYPATRVAKDISLSLDRTAWHARTNRGAPKQFNANQKSLFHAKSLREDGRSGRFETSTKPWLDKYAEVRTHHRNAASQATSSRTNTAVGQAMFNLKRTMPS